MKRLASRFRLIPAPDVAVLGMGLAFALTFTARAQTGIVAYDYLDFSSGQPVARLAVIKTDGTGDQLLPVSLPEPGFPAWSRNGQALALTSIDPARPNKVSRDVFLFRPGTGQLTKLTAFEDVANANGFRTSFPWYKAFSPDGQKLAIAGFTYFGARSILVYTNQNGTQYGPYETLSKSSSVPGLGVLDLNTGTSIAVNTGPSGDDIGHPGDGVDWSPTQNLLAYPINSLTVFENDTGPTPIAAIHLIEPVTDAVEKGRHQQITFPPGHLNSPFEPIHKSWGDDIQPAFSPDGKRVAYIRVFSIVTPNGREPSLPSLRIVNLDGSGDIEVIHFRQGDYIAHVTWSSDGSKLIFDLGAQFVYQGMPYSLITPDTVALYSIRLDGSGFAQLRGVPAAWPAGNPAGDIAPPPAPQIAGLIPTEAIAGGAGFELKVTGANYLNGTVVRWNGESLPTTVTSATELHATVAAGRIATKGTVTITVVTPGPTGQSSNQTLFTIKEVPAGAPPNLTFQITGDGTPSFVINWPTPTAAFVLESSARIGPLAFWNPVEANIVTAGGQSSVTLPLGPTTSFFRLHHSP